MMLRIVNLYKLSIDTNNQIVFTDDKLFGESSFWFVFLMRENNYFT
jgi:hypothetical protein